MIHVFRLILIALVFCGSLNPALAEDSKAPDVDNAPAVPVADKPGAGTQPANKSVTNSIGIKLVLIRAAALKRPSTRSVMAHSQSSTP